MTNASEMLTLLCGMMLHYVLDERDRDVRCLSISTTLSNGLHPFARTGHGIAAAGSRTDKRQRSRHFAD